MDSDNRPFAVVTGASTGIGFELARQFAEHGFDVLITAHEDLSAAAAPLRAAGADVMEVRADLRSHDEVERLWLNIREAGRPIDALALNAGVAANGAFVDTDLDEDLAVIQVNIASVVHLAKLVLPGMVERGSGRVLITSSIAATMPGPYYATYAASKAFLQSFAQAVRYELADSGVTVTALQPGPTDTPFFERAGMEDTRVGASDSKDDPADVAREGFEAMMAGKDRVIAGSLRNKAQVAATAVLPDSKTAGIHAAMTKPGSGEG